MRAKQPLEDLSELLNSAPSHVSEDVANDANSEKW